MEKKNRFISATYELYTVTDGKKELEEQTSPAHPFQFITGFGYSLDGFEKNVESLAEGETFDFTLQPAEAFGDYHPEGVHTLDKEVFSINGKFDGEHVYPGAIVTLVGAQEEQFMAKVVSIEGQTVTLDANHPLAGKTLNFTGKILENREATEEEIHHLIKQLTGGCEGCGGGCHKDGEGCGHHGEGCHKDGEGCGHHGEGGCCHE